MNVEKNGQQRPDDNNQETDSQIDIQLTALALGEISDPEEINRLKALLEKDEAKQKEYESTAHLGALIRDSVENDLPLAPGSIHDVVVAALADSEVTDGHRADSAKKEPLPQHSKIGGHPGTDESPTPKTNLSWWKLNRKTLTYVSTLSVLAITLAVVMQYRDWTGEPVNLALAERNSTEENESRFESSAETTDNKAALEEFSSAMPESAKPGSTMLDEESLKMDGVADPFRRVVANNEGAVDLNAVDQSAVNPSDVNKGAVGGMAAPKNGVKYQGKSEAGGFANSVPNDKLSDSVKKFRVAPNQTGSRFAEELQSNLSKSKSESLEIAPSKDASRLNLGTNKKLGMSSPQSGAKAASRARGGRPDYKLPAKNAPEPGSASGGDSGGGMAAGGGIAGGGGGLSGSGAATGGGGFGGGGTAGRASSPGDKPDFELKQRGQQQASGGRNSVEKSQKSVKRVRDLQGEPYGMSSKDGGLKFSDQLESRNKGASNELGQKLKNSEAKLGANAVRPAAIKPSAMKPAPAPPQTRSGRQSEFERTPNRSEETRGASPSGMSRDRGSKIGGTQSGGQGQPPQGLQRFYKQELKEKKKVDKSAQSRAKGFQRAGGKADEKSKEIPSSELGDAAGQSNDKGLMKDLREKTSPDPAGTNESDSKNPGSFFKTPKSAPDKFNVEKPVDRNSESEMKGGEDNKSEESIGRESNNAEEKLRELQKKATEAEDLDFQLPRIAPELENDFIQPIGTDAVSTFSIDTDTVSYTKIREMLRNGIRPHPEDVRIEEMVNYFDFKYSQPKAKEKFSVDMEVASSPWSPDNKILKIGLQARYVSNEERPPSNLVFLVDVSGSMRAANKLPLLKSGLKKMVQELTEDDYVSIVTYANNINVRLEPTDGSQKKKIEAIIDGLVAAGGTNGGEGLQTAYRLAEKHLLKGGTNRIVLGTDGDFNIGIQDDRELALFVKQKAQSGVFLTVCGFGTNNFKDGKMQIMSQNGNGKVYYIDSEAESQRIFADRISGSLVTIAQDVKLQLLFNPKTVRSYRLIGYENRMLATEDFDNDKKDAGEMDAGDSVTALYEIVPGDGKFTLPVSEIEQDIDLKYQVIQKQKIALTDVAATDDLAALRIRFKIPGQQESELREFVVKNNDKSFNRASREYQLATAVAGLGLMLRGSQHRGGLNFENLKEFGQTVLNDRPAKESSAKMLKGRKQDESIERQNERRTEQRKEVLELINRAADLYQKK